MIIECDVLVVGAGPAGSVAALYSSKQGLNTVLIERNNRVGAHTNTRIDEVTISQGGEKIVIKPEIIIAADGGDSIFHRHVNKRFVNKNRVACLNGFLSVGIVLNSDKMQKSAGDYFHFIFDSMPYYKLFWISKPSCFSNHPKTFSRSDSQNV